MSKIEKLKAAFEVSTPGWWRIGDAGAVVFGPKTGAPSPETVAAVRKKTNAEFIAISHNMMPALLGAVETLEAIRARLKGEFDHPALVKFGPLSVTRDDDILAMVDNALKEAGGGPILP